MESPSENLVDRLRQAVDAHDLEALVDCFEEDYRNETPAHPARGFQGREQVRANWGRIFAAVPDISARVLRTTSVDDVIWSEWEMRGTRVDGQEHLMSGVIIFGVAEDRASWARFYLEPVDHGTGGIDDAIGKIVNVDAGQS